MVRTTAVRILVGVTLVLVVAGSLSGQGVTEPTGTAQVKSAPADAKPPALTELQKVQLQSAAKDVELWQLKFQNAAHEYEKARSALQQLIASVTPAGYQLTSALELVKMSEPTKAAAPAPK